MHASMLGEGRHGALRDLRAAHGGRAHPPVQEQWGGAPATPGSPSAPSSRRRPNSLSLTRELPFLVVSDAPVGTQVGNSLSLTRELPFLVVSDAPVGTQVGNSQKR